VLGFVQAQAGPGAVAATVAGLIRGLGGFAAFLSLLAVLVEPTGAVAFGIASVAAVAVQPAMSAVRRARTPST
jgi:hypothetical protein